MKESEVLIVDFDSKKIEDALAGAKTALPEETFHVLETIVQSYLFLRRQLARKRASVERLQRMLFGPRSEKRRLIPPPSGESPSEKSATGHCEGAGKAKPPPPGHGRHGIDAYRSAETKNVPHDTLKAGEQCPGCLKGKVYEQRERPEILVRVTGQPPLAATIYHLQKLRCNLCQEIFSARPPEGVNLIPTHLQDLGYFSASVGKFHMGGNILQAGQYQWVVVCVMSIVTHQCTGAALGVIKLVTRKSVIDQYYRARLQ